MDLLDHFHPPLSVRRHWHSFHNAWATYLASDLNRRLPKRFFAEPNVQFGIEIDVATWEESVAVGGAASAEGATTPDVWTPPAPLLTVPFPIVTDVVEVSIYSDEAGPTLVGAIEIVSPANKDRAEHREAFVQKCATYLRHGIGLMIVDVVTHRAANLHNELCRQLDLMAEAEREGDLYASAFRPVDRNEQASLDIWHETLAVGRPLPTMPLWLRGAISLRVDLDASYERTCQEQRVS